MQTPNKVLLNCLLIVAVGLLIPQKSFTTTHTIDIALRGTQEVPPNPSTGLGNLTGTYDDATNTLSFNVVFTSLLTGTTAAHFHGPAAPGVNAPVVIGFTGFPTGVTSGSYSNSYVLTAAQETDLLNGLWYVNIHTTTYPGGEIRGQLKEPSSPAFDISLTGGQEVPPNPSTGLGNLTGTYNDATNTLSFNVVFTGLLTGTTAAHFHGPAAPGVNAPVVIGFVGFPLGVTSGSYSNSYVLTAAQETDLLNGLWYVNIHTTTYPGGEIRGQITFNVPPENTPPSCNITGIIAGPPKQIQITVQDLQSGLATVEVLTSTNANTVVPAFTPGTTDPVVVTATKINQSSSATVVLRVTDVAGNTIDCDPVYTTISAEVPQEFVLGANYPNPFNPGTRINFNIPKPEGSVSLKVFDVVGREVKTLISEPMQAGQYFVEWDGTNNQGIAVTSGVYIYRMVAGNFIATRRMILMK